MTRISTQVLLDLPSWKIVLLLAKPAAGGIARASTALDICRARASDLPMLAELGFIEGMRGDDILDLTDQDNWAQGLATVELLLTPAGRKWVENCPFNLILFATYTRGGRSGADLWEISRHAHCVDATWFTRLARARRIEVVNSDGEPINPDHLGTVIHRVLRQRVRLTDTGRELVTI
jgi:hypothetical protein